MQRSSHQQTADHHSCCIFGLLYGHDVWAFSLDLDAWQVYKLETVTKAHISTNVVENKENEGLLIKTFGYVPNRGEFIETIMNEGCPAYVKKITITPREATEVIREAGGKAVLAHPVGFKYENNLEVIDDSFYKSF